MDVYQYILLINETLYRFAVKYFVILTNSHTCCVRLSLDI